MLTLDKIYHAAFVLKDVARRTDLIEAPRLHCDCQLYLKTENLQVTGSFKVRGAYYEISQLSEEERTKGVIACSAGNHAQGVALAATRRGIKSIVCMPDGAPLMKVENTKNLGAEVCLVPGTYDDAHDKAVELQAETGMTFIHPYDDEQVIAGQGTIGLEYPGPAAGCGCRDRAGGRRRIDFRRSLRHQEPASGGRRSTASRRRVRPVCTAPSMSTATRP